jgi:carbon storage regulator
MLVLTRKEKQEIVIGRGITVRVVDIRRGKVRLGVTAPAEMDVFRRELIEPTGRTAHAAP